MSDPQPLPKGQTLTEDEGSSLVEYALLIGLIAAVALLAVTTLGTLVAGSFGSAIGTTPTVSTTQPPLIQPITPIN